MCGGTSFGPLFSLGHCSARYRTRWPVTFVSFGGTVAAAAQRDDARDDGCVRRDHRISALTAPEGKCVHRRYQLSRVPSAALGTCLGRSRPLAVVDVDREPGAHSTPAADRTEYRRHKSAPERGLQEAIPPARLTQDGRAGARLH
jgi:hypothetical protein